MCQIHNFRSRPCLHGNRQAHVAAAAGPANPWGFYLGCVFVRAAAAERFDQLAPPLQTAWQQQRPLPVAGGGSCCWRRALIFASARLGAPQKSASARGGMSWRGQMGKSGRRPLEEAALRLEPHVATTATAASGRERKLLLAPRSNICKGVSPAANIG